MSATTNSKVLYCDDGQETRSHTTFRNVSQGRMPIKSDDGVGYELDLIGRTDGRTDDMLNEVNEFHTGVILNAPRGFHWEVYGTPELWRSGYFIPSGLLVVANDEEIIIPLVKYTDRYPDLKCGDFRGVNVILRENITTHIVPDRPVQQPMQKVAYYAQPQQGYYMPQMQPPPMQLQPDRNVRAPPRKGNTMM